jgi:hypothetical protein
MCVWRAKDDAYSRKLGHNRAKIKRQPVCGGSATGQWTAIGSGQGIANIRRIVPRLHSAGFKARAGGFGEQSRQGRQLIQAATHGTCRCDFIPEG